MAQTDNELLFMGCIFKGGQRRIFLAGSDNFYPSYPSKQGNFRRKFSISIKISLKKSSCYKTYTKLYFLKNNLI